MHGLFGFTNGFQSQMFQTLFFRLTFRNKYRIISLRSRQGDQPALARLNGDRKYLNTSGSIQIIKNMDLMPCIVLHQIFLMSWCLWVHESYAKTPCSLCTWVGDVARFIQMFSHLHAPDKLEKNKKKCLQWTADEKSTQSVKKSSPRLNRRHTSRQCTKDQYLKWMHWEVKLNNMTESNNVSINVNLPHIIVLYDSKFNAMSSSPIQYLRPSTFGQYWDLKCYCTAQPQAASPTASKSVSIRVHKKASLLAQAMTNRFLHWFYSWPVQWFKRAPRETTSWNHAKHLEIPIAWVPSPPLAWPNQNVLGGLEFDLDPKSTIEFPNWRNRSVSAYLPCESEKNKHPRRCVQETYIKSLIFQPIKLQRPSMQSNWSLWLEEFLPCAKGVSLPL